MVKKIHTRQKRYISYAGGRNRSSRPKTFSTEDAAKKWAEAKKIKSYELVNLKSSDSSKKKIRVVVK